MSRQLVVVGAGPGGLSTALAAHALGVDVVVLERDPEDRARAGSRALFLHRDSLRLLERASAGLGRRLGERGLVWQRRTTMYRGRTVYSEELPTAAVDGLPPFTSLRQIDTEAILREAVAAAGIEVVYGVNIVSVQPEPTEVVARSADGSCWRSSYLVAADGSRSEVRESLGIALLGARSDSYHVVIDVAGEPARKERIFHYHHPRLDGRHVLIVPFAGGCQVDLQCSADDDPDQWSGVDEVSRWLPLVLDDDGSHRVLWRARYPFLQRVAASMADPSGRVLLVGEAGHLFAPFGARGMNSAIADADAAACAVACALAARTPGRAKAAVLDYSRIRGAAAEFNCAAAGAALRHMRPASAAERLAQSGAALLAPLVPRLGSWLEHAPYGPRVAATIGPSRY
ncbi:FAD-dependent oxidoreductase [Nocardia sp. NPDC003979]